MIRNDRHCSGFEFPIDPLLMSAVNDLCVMNHFSDSWVAVSAYRLTTSSAFLMESLQRIGVPLMSVVSIGSGR